MRSISRISSSTSALFLGSSYFTLTHMSLSSGCRLWKVPKGKIDHVVVGIFAAAEGLLALVEHADDGVEAGLDVDFFADRV
jgi:hypothetical protein